MSPSTQRIAALFTPSRPPRGRVRLGPRNIYILPTRYGMLYVALLLIMVIGSMNYSNNLGYLLTFLLTGQGLVTMLHTWRNLESLEVRDGRVEPVFAGQEACFELVAVNHRRQPRFGLRLQAEGASEFTEDLAPEGAANIHLRARAERRGVLRLGRVTLSTEYPLGLFRAWAYLQPDLECLVYPRPAESGDPPVESVFTESGDGDQGVGADDFVGPRSYRPGDSPRHVDWKAYARERGLISKQFGGDRAERISLDWELLRGFEPETRLCLLCRFVLLAAEQHQSFGLRLPGVEIPEGRGEAHKRHCLAALARFKVRP